MPLSDLAFPALDTAMISFCCSWHRLMIRNLHSRVTLRGYTLNKPTSWLFRLLDKISYERQLTLILCVSFLTLIQTLTFHSQPYQTYQLWASVSLHKKMCPL
jgi:hypothetical protein